jgi:CDP-paratose 2-epimerase
MTTLITGCYGFVEAAVRRRLGTHVPGTEITVFNTLRRIGAESNRSAMAALGFNVMHGDVRMPSFIAAIGPFDSVIDAAHASTFSC